ncbi:hypothetical protein [Adhaeribacter soli]|uniref:HEAT repeat domain-containing protein n=1 Tax=Adhaeribacter soli TaxID=2607655 RepID=A0A5N1J4G6_9BACT|nr:hypothetical protein [Adhaeribacter soli]KAA9340965.1 hypothetical protein F0P94_05940 [Adhaeribacter soli]
MNSATQTSTLTEYDLTGTVSHLYNLLEQNPELFPILFREMMDNPKSQIRLRAGNAVEKAARKNPALLLPFRAEMLEAITKPLNNEAIWHVALLLGYINPEGDDLALAVNKLFHWLDSVPHKFVKVNCLQTLALLALKHSWLQPEVTEMLEAALEHESFAIQARARILLKQFKPKKNSIGSKQKSISGGI